MNGRRSSINPITNMSLLVRNGTRLRRLALANVLFQVLNGNNALISTLALDALEWTPASLSTFSAFQSAADMCAQGLVLPALFLRRARACIDAKVQPGKYGQGERQERGMQRAFLVGSVGSITSCLLMSQCWRPSCGWCTAAVFLVAEGLRAHRGRSPPLVYPMWG